MVQKPETSSASCAVTAIDPLNRLLMVDDDAALLLLYKTMLEVNGFSVTTASNGVEALKIIMHTDMDAIICDLMMPRMAGDMFYIAVERIKPHLCPRFIFVTGNEHNPKFEDFLQRIKPVVLPKPITIGKLTGTLMLLLSRSPSAHKKR